MSRGRYTKSFIGRLFAEPSSSESFLLPGALLHPANRESRSPFLFSPTHLHCAYQRATFDTPSRRRSPTRLLHAAQLRELPDVCPTAPMPKLIDNEPRRY